MSDLIEREPIIKRLNRVIEHGVASKTTGLHPISAETVKAYIEALPPAEQRTGRWLINSDGYYPYCSECKTEPKSGELTPYCPYCGARMNADKESENEQTEV